MKKLAFLFTILLIGVFASCSKDDSNNLVTHQYNATIRVTVLQEYSNNGSYADSALAGARVDVYENKDDRDNVLSPDYSKTTNINGLAEFDNLDKGYYYLRVVNPKTQAVLKDETNTPDGTISFVEVVF